MYGDATYSLANYAGYFNGNLATTAGWSVPSDSILKTDIAEITNALDVLKSISAYTYKYKTEAYPSINLPTDDKIPGLISEQVAPVIPAAVHTIIHPAVYDSMGNIIYEQVKYLGLDYTKVIPYLVSAVNELKAEMDKCCGYGYRSSNPNDDGNTNNITVELKNPNSNFLGQSVPNPHSTQCTIPYRIDASVVNAEIVFTDQVGGEMNRVEIVTRGAGQLTLLTSQLEDGLYNYSLVIDGKVIDTKKFIKQH